MLPSHTLEGQGYDGLKFIFVLVENRGVYSYLPIIFWNHPAIILICWKQSEIGRDVYIFGWGWRMDISVVEVEPPNQASAYPYLITT
jgi:hypothetical protein